MSRWKSSLAGSLLINCLLLTGGALYLNYSAPEPNAKPEAIEMEIVSDDAAPSAPQISAPKQQKVDIPPPPTREEVQQMVNDAPNTIPVEDKKIDDSNEPPVRQTLNNNNDRNDNNNELDNNNNNNNPPKKTGLARQAQALYAPKPVVPQIGEKDKINDSVVVKYYVNEQGTVDWVEIVESSGNDAVDEAVKAQILSWQYEPELKDDGEVDFAIITRRVLLDYPD